MFLTRLLFALGIVAAIKSACHHMGLCSSLPALPMLGLNHAGEARVRDLLDALPAVTHQRERAVS